jgi:hypothetical protein
MCARATTHALWFEKLENRVMRASRILKGAMLQTIPVFLSSKIFLANEYYSRVNREVSHQHENDNDNDNEHVIILRVRA